MNGMMQDLAFAIPGIDEAMGFAEVMKCAAHLSLSSPVPLYFLAESCTHPQTSQVDAVLGHRL